MIHQYLDLSTGHLTRRTMDMLTCYEPHVPNPGWPAMTIASYGFGAFVTVPYLDNPDIAKQMEALPPELANVLRVAHLAGATLVCFDADGDINPTLPYKAW